MKRSNRSNTGWRNLSAKQPRVSPNHMTGISPNAGSALELSSQPGTSVSHQSPESATEKHHLSVPAVSGIIGESGTGGPLFIPDEVLQVIKAEADEDGASVAGEAGSSGGDTFSGYSSGVDGEAPMDPITPEGMEGEEEVSDGLGHSGGLEGEVKHPVLINSYFASIQKQSKQALQTGGEISPEPREAITDNKAEENSHTVVPTTSYVPGVRVQGTGPGRYHRQKSWVWEYFSIDPGDPTRVTCMICQQMVKRGTDPKRLGTSSLGNHIKHNHNVVYMHQKNLSGQQPGTGGATEPHSTLHGATLKQRPGCSISRAPAITKRLATYASHLSVSESVQRSTKYHRAHPRALALNAACAKMLALDLLPFSHVEGEGFREMMAAAAPRWQVPSRSFFSKRAVPELCRAVKASVLQALRGCKGGRVHLAVDMWTSGQTTDYMSISAHWVSLSNSSILRQHATLFMCGLEKQHSARHVLERLQAVIGEWLTPLSLSPGFVASDDGQRVRRALREGGFPHVMCLAHCLALVVREFLHSNEEVDRVLAATRKICTYFSRSYAARHLLWELQVENHLPRHQLKKEVAARWSSTLRMLERLYEQRVAIQACLRRSAQAQRDRGLHLAPSDWPLIHTLCHILRPFDDATKLVSGANVGISQAIPLICLLEKKLLSLVQQYEGEGNETGLALALSLLQTLQGNRQIMEIRSQEHYILATYMDPRFKNNMAAFMPSGDSSLHCWTQRLIDEVAENIRDTGETSTGQRQQQCEGSASDQGRSLWDSLEDFGLISVAPASQDSAKAQAAQIVEGYLQDTVLMSASAEPLLYWQLKRDVWLPLFQVAVQHLSCPPSSLYSEQLFTTAATIVKNRRTCLSTGSVESLAFIKMNKHLLPQEYRVPEHVAGGQDVALQDIEEEEEEEEEEEMDDIME
ncbi:zinc finger BED domain-containing protein 6 [Alligator mississippiensis]|nr:zinc finger BED domain-containing protein 6 [Alligator mississippiensis]XP_019354627.1 zinc finger BED domain-containing protein 6 [Alligator mississippiensis]XP_019354628.1 zinc finger BED domain-containing protein 6 [Alligator mississippiensis]XP_019354629.1 zinc finger BED domain-containing protein 6 [Alligator mississippiensis]